MLVQIEKDQTRIAELEGLFAAANETDEEDADLENVDTENGVLPKALVKALKDERKVLAAEVRELTRQTGGRRRGSRQAVMFAEADQVAESSGDDAVHEEKQKRIQEIDQQLERHAALDAELKKLKANIREVENQKDEMIAAARRRSPRTKRRR